MNLQQLIIKESFEQFLLFPASQMFIYSVILLLVKLHITFYSFDRWKQRWWAFSQFAGIFQTKQLIKKIFIRLIHNGNKH